MASTSDQLQLIYLLLGLTCGWSVGCNTGTLAKNRTCHGGIKLLFLGNKLIVHIGVEKVLVH